MNQTQELVLQERQINTLIWKDILVAKNTTGLVRDIYDSRFHINMRDEYEYRIVTRKFYVVDTPISDEG